MFLLVSDGLTSSFYRITYLIRNYNTKYMKMQHLRSLCWPQVILFFAIPSLGTIPDSLHIICFFCARLYQQFLSDSFFKKVLQPWLYFYCCVEKTSTNVCFANRRLFCKTDLQKHWTCKTPPSRGKGEIPSESGDRIFGTGWPRLHKQSRSIKLFQVWGPDM